MYANQNVIVPRSDQGADDLYARLVPISWAGLQRTFNARTSVFDQQIRDGRMASTRGTEDLTSTCICLIGMDRHASLPASRPANSATILEAAVQLAARRKYVGGFGLLLWASAVCDGAGAEELARRTGTPLGHPRHHEQITTMELAWLVSGLLHDLRRSGGARLEALAHAALSALMERYVPATGLMRHATSGGSLQDRIRGRIANFADQIYTIQALAFAAIALDSEAARRLAVLVSQTIVATQGEYGQWWWHYDAATGSVSEGYPVYSVHQHAMAPMALMAVEAAGGPSFMQNIRRGHSWLYKNELGVRLVDANAGAIWRDIERADGPVVSVWRKAGELTGLRTFDTSVVPRDLKVNFETRPYEWAWCLYAAAIASGQDRKGHIV